MAEKGRRMPDRKEVRKEEKDGDGDPRRRWMRWEVIPNVIRVYGLAIFREIVKIKARVKEKGIPRGKEKDGERMGTTGQHNRTKERGKQSRMVRPRERGKERANRLERYSMGIAKDVGK